MEQAQTGITRVKMEIRLLHDLKQPPIKQYAGLSQLSESVFKQLAAWVLKPDLISHFRDFLDEQFALTLYPIRI